MERIERPLARRILTKIEKLSREPRPPGCRKIQGASQGSLAATSRRLPQGATTGRYAFRTIEFTNHAADGRCVTTYRQTVKWVTSRPLRGKLVV